MTPSRHIAVICLASLLVVLVIGFPARNDVQAAGQFKPVERMSGPLEARLAPAASPLMHTLFLPVIQLSPPEAPSAIVIDHTTTDITLIPDYWIEQAKLLTIHFAHTSHGSQVISGAQWLETENIMYNFDLRVSTAVGLPADTTAMRMYDGNAGSTTYITPDLYWDGETGKNNTRIVSNSGLFGFSMWSWCGQQSTNDVATVERYLDVMDAFETEFPSMRFIYMTGHTDGTDSSGTLFRNNNLVRQYAQSHGKVLYDFADIETFDPDGGGPYFNNSEGTCTWCKAYCDNHPGYCASLPSSCAHTNSTYEQMLFCKLKGQAFWWMMARLAGWSGPP